MASPEGPRRLLGTSSLPSFGTAGSSSQLCRSRERQGEDFLILNPALRQHAVLVSVLSWRSFTWRSSVTVSAMATRSGWAWKNLNGGKAVNGNPNGVQLPPSGTGNAAEFSLAGLQKVSIATQAVYDHGAVAPIAADIKHTLGLPTPNGFIDQGRNAQGINCTIDATGVVTMTYDADGGVPF